MRLKLAFLITLLLLAGIAMIPACGDGGGTGGSGGLIADFDLEGEEYLADPDTPLERFCQMFSSRIAYALPDLGFNPNSYPFNIFTGARNAQEGLQVIISSPDMTLIAQSSTNTSGRVQFSDLPTGFLMMTITGEDGNNYNIPIQISENTESRTRVLVFRNPDSGDVEVTSKTIHDGDADGMNDDDFSYAMFGRPRNQQTGGQIHLHLGEETRIDGNGDGDFNDPEDENINEPDDDGVPSDEGDGDEDNDGIPDNVDDDIDGDGIPNGQDDDIDGDGIPNADDSNPDGITPNDDFDPPTLDGGEPYSGVMELSQIDEDTVTVMFPAAVDEMNEPVSYIIYYSTTSPVDIATAARQRFTPIGPVSPDDILQDNVTGLVFDQKYNFVVHAIDSAQPPNEDDNTEETGIVIE